MSEEANEAWVLISYPDGPFTESHFGKKSVPMPQAGEDSLLRMTMMMTVMMMMMMMMMMVGMEMLRTVYA